MSFSLWNDTPGLTQRLQQLLEAPENYPFSTIAPMLSKEFNIRLTKNACIGKSRRLKMPPREARPPKIRQYVYKPRVKTKPREPEHAGLITIYQLRDFVDCKWPIGELPDLLYCGQPQEEGQVYCTKHCDLAYHPGRKHLQPA
jgi:hypothetical protein